MRKIFSLLTALTLSVGLWAEMVNVSYLYPEYNTDDDVTSGIKEWKTGEKEATLVDFTSASSKMIYLGVKNQITWYVVSGTIVCANGNVTCQGDVHLILADGAKLSVVMSHGAGLCVNSTTSVTNKLTIYAQSTDPMTMGQLIADGGKGGAGIGGNNSFSGSNITINGGLITAIGSVENTDRAAGIGGGGKSFGYNITINGGIVTAFGAAGIGGGSDGSCHDVIINGGVVTATGGGITWPNGVAIGSLKNNSKAYNIYVSPDLIIKAGDTESTAEVIASDRTATTDIANSLENKKFAFIAPNVEAIKTTAKNEIDALITDVTNVNIIAIATNAKTAIDSSTDAAEINKLKTQALSNIASAKAAYGEAYAEGETAGDAAGYQRAQDELPTEGYEGPAVIITKGEKVLTLFNPEKVEYQILEAD